MPDALAIYFHVLPYILENQLLGYLLISHPPLYYSASSSFQISDDKAKVNVLESCMWLGNIYITINHEGLNRFRFPKVTVLNVSYNVLNQSHVKLLTVLFCAKALNLKVLYLKVTGECWLIGPSPLSIHRQWQRPYRPEMDYKYIIINLLGAICWITN